MPEAAGVCKGETTALSITSHIPDGAVLTFASDDEQTATVTSDGKVTGVADGVATVTARITLNGVVLVSRYL